jgi:hypothetical protein
MEPTEYAPTELPPGTPPPFCVTFDDWSYQAPPGGTITPVPYLVFHRAQ